MVTSFAQLLAAALTAAAAPAPQALAGSGVHATCIIGAAAEVAVRDGSEATGAGADVLVIVADADVETVRVNILDEDGETVLDTVFEGRLMHVALPPGTCARLP